jgi:hypothetical protein
MQPFAIPGASTIAYAEHEQFIWHCFSQFARLILVFTQTANEESGSNTLSTFTNPSPGSHTEEDSSPLLTQHMIGMTDMICMFVLMRLN